jgi:hypothetical protein
MSEVLNHWPLTPAARLWDLGLCSIYWGPWAVFLRTLVFPYHYHSTCVFFYTFLSWNLLFNRETNGRSLGIFQQKWSCFGNRWALRKISAFPFLFSNFKGFIFDKISEKGVKAGIEASPKQSCSYFLCLSFVLEVIFSNLSWASSHSNWGSSCFIPGLPKKCCVLL